MAELSAKKLAMYPEYERPTKNIGASILECAPMKSR